jgi:hypothetical protein
MFRLAVHPVSPTTIQRQIHALAHREVLVDPQVKVAYSRAASGRVVAEVTVGRPGSGSEQIEVSNQESAVRAVLKTC